MADQSTKLKRIRNNKVSFSDIIIRIDRMTNFDNKNLNQFLESKQGIDGKYNNDWPELLFFKANLYDLAKRLIQLPISIRRLIIMREEILGFSKNQLYNDFGFNNNKMNYFIEPEKNNKMDNDKKSAMKSDVKVRVRRVIPRINFPIEFLAFISLLSRIPMQWLMLRNPEEKWSTEHFALLNDIVIHTDELRAFVLTLKPDQHDVRGVILQKNESDKTLYLRVENLYGTLIIELCNTYATTDEYREFINLFKGQSFEIGHMSTVIPSQINHTVIMRHPLSNRLLCYPIEFQLYKSLY